MMPKSIIPVSHHWTRNSFKWENKKGDPYLVVSEMYCDTIQGEGVYIGTPSVFLRLQGCGLNCNYCDTTEVWRYGTPWTFNELFHIMEVHHNIPSRLEAGEHLVITGGSPLLQQHRLGAFLQAFDAKYKFLPFVEIENECIFMPTMELIPYVDCWNNSPKLSTSGVPFPKRYDPDVIEATARLSDSWFKFVITKEEDWNEIFDDFIRPALISPEQVILMPEGKTRKELEVSEMITLELAVRHQVRYSPRLHIMLWNDQKGV